MKDYYRTLGVSETATATDIKQAYRKLAKQWHPDKSSHPNANEKFQEINEANTILSDDDKRRHYDAMRSGGPQVRFTQGNFSDADIHSVFDEIFGGMGGFGNNFRQQRQQTRQTVYNVVCTLEEAYTGTQKTVNGKCANIPAGVRDGSLFQVDNNLFRASVLPHQRFQRHNDDLVLKVELTAFDAMLGTSVEVKHIDGNVYTLNVPAGTQHGHQLRIKNKGMPNPQIPGKIGHLYVVCDISIPNDLTDKQKKCIIDMVYTPKTYRI